MERVGIEPPEGLEIHNARLSDQNARYTEYLYGRLRRRGYLLRDCQRMVNNDRNVFGACMVALGDADGMVTGLTRNYAVAFEEVLLAIDAKPAQRVFGLSMVLTRNRTVFVSDTSIHQEPDPEALAEIAVASAHVVRRLGHEPRVALLSHATFGNPVGPRSQKVREAIAILDKRRVDFEYDGEMAADVALDRDLMKRLYPFSRLSEAANVLIMPSIDSANISTTLLQEMGGSTVVGPILIGLERPVQIASLGATVSDLVNLAAIAAFDPSA